MSNFIDSETGEKFLIPSHQIVHRQGKWIYVDKKTKEQITNPKTGNILKSIPKEGIPERLVSNDKATLQKMLKKRSHDHYDKEIKETKYQMNKDLINKFEDK